MTADRSYLMAVVQQAVEQLRRDLDGEGYPGASVAGELVGGEFVFTLRRDTVSRSWTYPVDEPVYAYQADGSDPSTHALWLATLVAEENTDLLHRAPADG